MKKKTASIQFLILLRLIIRCALWSRKYGYRSSRRQYFTIDIAIKQLLHLLFFWTSVRYLNLVNSRPSQ